MPLSSTTSRPCATLSPVDRVPPDPPGSGAALAARTDARLDRAGRVSNGVGGVVVFVYIAFLFPNTVDPDDLEAAVLRNGVLFVTYMLLTLPLGRHFVQRRPFVPIERWLRDERPATEEDRLTVLRYPAGWARRSAIFWGVGALLFALMNLSAGFVVAAGIGLTVVLGGVTACALQYLVVERMLRPVTARALAGGSPPGRAGPGVAARMTMAWMLATGVPVLGIAALAVIGLVSENLDSGQVVGGALFLAVLALAVGLLAIVVAAQSVAEPLGSVRGALERIERGDFQARSPVDDGSEVGLLQAGFNRMASGLEERERLRDAFGTFVDPELTQRVLEEGTDLAGEEVELSVMFLDVRNFTTFAERADATEVVARLNDLYGLVVPIVLRHGGHVSKFIGDGLLAVFGAPERLVDHAPRAVAAALDIAREVRGRYGDELRVGVGVNSGRVVVGTIGGGGRLDFTVIGDPVNTAARVEAATRRTGDDVLITATTRSFLDSENGEWQERPPIPLKGKSEDIRLYAPASPAAEAVPRRESAVSERQP